MALVLALGPSPAEAPVGCVDSVILSQLVPVYAPNPLIGTEYIRNVAAPGLVPIYAPMALVGPEYVRVATTRTCDR
jgi:hypothetical protein